MKQQQPIHTAGQADAVAIVPREHLKSLFHLVCGRPDNVLKVFNKPIALRFEDLFELADMVSEKLKHYTIDAVTMTIDISYEGGITKQYSDLSDFQEKTKSGHEKTESILLRWDILVKLPQYAAPQRHTLTVRAATAIKPKQLLQFILSSEASEADKVDTDMAPIFCRVDYIDHLLSEELLAIVSRWYEGRLKSLTYSSFYFKARKYRRRIADAINWSIPFFLGTLATVYFVRSDVVAIGTSQVTMDALRATALWIFISLLLVYASKQFSHWLAGKTYHSLDKYGSFGVFAFTRGDANKQSELEQANSDTGREFLITSATALIINLIAGVMVALLFRQ
jgi:hypothetical protein